MMLVVVRAGFVGVERGGLEGKGFNFNPHSRSSQPQLIPPEVFKGNPLPPPSRQVPKCTRSPPRTALGEITALSQTPSWRGV